MAWSKAQAKSFVADVRQTLREAWTYMVPATRDAYICAYAFGVARSQASGTVQTADLDRLILDMREFAGLSQDGVLNA